MNHLPRHEEILKILTRLRSISVQELTTRLNVSEVTI
ncbi:MAG: DeoR family transcriptional regulator, partial [Spirochaetales bacterium]|nr:DeoR family transcriptional regulator [Spirochaetales bacterium]